MFSLHASTASPRLVRRRGRSCDLLQELDPHGGDVDDLSTLEWNKRNSAQAVSQHTATATHHVVQVLHVLIQDVHVGHGLLHLLQWLQHQHEQSQSMSSMVKQQRTSRISSSTRAFSFWNHSCEPLRQHIRGGTRRQLQRLIEQSCGNTWSSPASVQHSTFLLKSLLLIEKRGNG